MSRILLDSNPALVTSTSTNSTVLEFTEELDPIRSSVEVAFIEVVSGTFNFNVNGTASTANGSYTSGDKIPLSFGNGKLINFKAANIGETFKISF